MSVLFDGIPVGPRRGLELLVPVIARIGTTHQDPRGLADQFDLVVTDDLGRVCRRDRAVDFCESCEDTDTRLPALNDSTDTAREDWRPGAFFASFEHESGNRDTARRGGCLRE